MSHTPWVKNPTAAKESKVSEEGVRALGMITAGGITAAAAAPAIASTALPGLVVNYGTQVATASLGSRFIAAGADAGVQYVENLSDKGFGMNNLMNINLSSPALAFINPASIVTTGIGGNFLKFSGEDRFSKAIGGSEFNLKTSTFSSIVDILGGKLGDKIQGKAVIAGFKPLVGTALGEVTSNAVAAPANVIVENATETPQNK